MDVSPLIFFWNGIFVVFVVICSPGMLKPQLLSNFTWISFEIARMGLKLKTGIAIAS